MKTIGLIGGMSWESTVTYYQVVNTVVKEKLGGLHSAKCVIHSVEFSEIEACQKSGDWAGSAKILGDAAQSLERAGADCVLICTNTMHKVADEVQAAVKIPLIHIADVTADALVAAGVKKVALLGSKYTMEQDFYTKKLHARGIETCIPNAEDREFVNHLIFGELCVGEISVVSKMRFLSIIEELAQTGARAAVLGCTELGLLVKQHDTDIPLFDTAIIHAKAAADFALGVQRA